MRSTGSSCVTDEDLSACADLVRRGDPDRFMAAMAAPVAARGVLFPLFAFNLEVARAPWVTQEPMIAEMRLQWWRDVLAEIRSGGPVRRHEVATPLSAMLDAEGAGLLDDLIVARRWDIYRAPFADRAAFDDYLTRTSGHLMWVAARALGTASRDAVLSAGYAHGMANFLRAIPALEEAGRMPLVDGRAEAVRDLARDAMSRLALARAQRSRVTRSARPALLPLWKTSAVLRRAARDPHHVAAGTLDVAPLRGRFTLMVSALSGRW